MEYASFYGGRKGASFIIVKNYLDIPSMVQDFSQGGAFTGVNYDEYVLINTVNKNHPDNGKIFRRGYDYNSTRKIEAYIAYQGSTAVINGTPQQYQNASYEYVPEYDAGGAVYVGTIVGPAGRSPQLTMTTYALAAAKHATQGFDEQQSHGAYSLTDESLVPGKYEEGTSIQFNDQIQWFCTSIRDEFNEDGQAYIGLKIPYPVIDFQTIAVDPYDTNANYADMTKAERQDDGTHPFYENWQLSIPKGIKGDTIRNFRVMVPTGNDTVYQIGSDPEVQYEGKADDVEYGRSILVYDYYNYDDVQNPSAKTYYIGDYNQITDFTIDNYGTVTVAFSHNDTITYNQLIKWITDIQLNTENGHFVITYNTIDYYEPMIDDQTGDPIIDEQTGDPIEVPVFDQEEFTLDWVKDIQFSEDGTVQITYTDSNTVTNSNLIKWINDISLATSDIESQDPEEEDIIQGTFKIQYNYGEDLIAYLKWVNNISLSNHGQLVLHYSGNGEDKTISDNFIKWINNISLDNDGTLTFQYNTGHYETQGSTQIWIPDQDQMENKIKWITGVDFDSQGHLTITYNTIDSTTGQHETFTNTGNQIKWIRGVTLDPNGNFKVEYNTVNRIEGTTPIYDSYNTVLKWPKTITINTDTTDDGVREGYGNQKLKINYTTGNPQEIGKPINYIIKTVITSDHHLIVLYSDPDRRQYFIDHGMAYRFSYSGQGNAPYTSEGYAGWLDLGSIYSDSGILIGTNILLSDVQTYHSLGSTAPTQAQIIAYLNHLYPNGLYGDFLNQKLITVGEEGEDKFFYGFDYTKETVDNQEKFKGWYFLGTISSSSSILGTDSSIPGDIQQGTLCFIIEEFCSITKNLTGLVSSDPATSRPKGFQNYSTRLDGAANISSISVTMGGTDITNNVYNPTNRTINIAQITGDIVITAVGTT